MTRQVRRLAIAGSLLLALGAGDGALAQKSGGVLKISFFDSPASMSLHEEATGAALRPAMGLFNNLVMYDQHVAQNSPSSIMYCLPLPRSSAGVPRNTTSPESSPASVANATAAPTPAAAMVL